MISLKAINEENFVDAFNLKLAKGQEEYVSPPVRSLAQAYVVERRIGSGADDTLIAAG